jgi:AcrR family transcriptional regulator
MARQKDETKRTAILNAAKSLFAKKGFNATSISDLRRESGFSTGTIYTYFNSKEDIVSAIIEEGWDEMVAYVRPILQSDTPVSKRAEYLAYEIIPQVIRDEDLIHILLTEALDVSGLSEKLSRLLELVLQMGQQPVELSREDRRQMQTSITIYFLGILEAVRLTRRTDLGFYQEDILRFIKDTIIRELTPSSSD